MDSKRLVVKRKDGGNKGDVTVELATALVKVVALVLVRTEGKSPPVGLRLAKMLVEPMLPSFDIKLVKEPRPRSLTPPGMTRVRISDFPTMLNPQPSPGPRAHDCGALS